MFTNRILKGKMDTRELDRFLNREILTNVSCLVGELMPVDKFQDELWEMQTLDYDAAAYDCLFNAITTDYIIEFLQDNLQDSLIDNDKGKIRENTWYYITQENLQESFCDFMKVEPEQREIFEYWLVTEYLGRKLEACGEAVLFDFYGLTIWGRTTTGQAIALDGVIQKIFEELSA